ncbi:MAG TPA: hypothetical protein VGC41_20690 [Kofleriaceae bacterium]
MHPIQTIETKDLATVTGGGADIGGIMQMASPLLSMIPGIGPMLGMITPMLGQLGGGAKKTQQQPQQAQQAQPQQQPQQTQSASE